MNVDLDPAEIRWLADLVEAKRTWMRVALHHRIVNESEAAPDPREMRRAVAVAEKLEAALRPGAKEGAR